MPCSSLRLRHMTCEELEMKEPMKFFSNDFLAVALFSGIGLVVSLIAVICARFPGYRFLRDACLGLPRRPRRVLNGLTTLAVAASAAYLLETPE
jgi:hypothetical protein